MTSDIALRPVQKADLDDLIRLENQCFITDRLSRRSFRHWLQSDHCTFGVATCDGELIAYSLIIFFRGTTLARLYSVAVSPKFRGRGIAERLITEGESQAKSAGRIYLRLEVDTNNKNAIKLYEKMGYRPFGIYHSYYEDSHDALRMQKCIRSVPPAAENRPIPWLHQSTPFTCGPAALMMAMRSLCSGYNPTPREELQIWREATTIFMTAGHGGCHPVGLALAARKRGFTVEVWLNQESPLFVDSVRDADKKKIIELAHNTFTDEAKKNRIRISHREFTDRDLVNYFDKGFVPIILISTYRMDGKKAPHWVVMSGYDADCLYVHDPDPDPDEQSASGLDSQYIPIARSDFIKMSRFGKKTLRTAVIVKSVRTSALSEGAASRP